MRSDAALRRAITGAEKLLPGQPAPGKRDPRWLAIIRVGDFIETHPAEVCAFAIKWMKIRGADLQAAISCCLVEHLLEHHFDVVFPIMRREALKNARVAEHFYPYSPHFKFGQAELPKNVALLKRLARELKEEEDEREKKRHRARIKKQKPPRGLAAD